jgi:Bacteriophage tail sheath protein
VATIKHGVYGNILPTLQRITQLANADVPVFVGLAPVHRIVGGATNVNDPFLSLDPGTTLAYLGYDTNWAVWTLSEVYYAEYTLFNQFNKPSPIFVNVFNPLVHFTPVGAAQLTQSNGVITIPFATADVIIDSVVVKNTAGSVTLLKGTNYITGYDASNNFLITILDSNPTTTYTVSYNKANPAAVTSSTIIGGTDANNNNSGLSVINDVFVQSGVVPGILYAPGFMQNSLVATAIDALVQSVNGVFFARSGPVECDNIVTARSPQGAFNFKTTNSVTDSRQDLVWPPIMQNGPLNFHSGTLITILEGVVTQNPAQGNGVPYWSVSNNALPITGIALSDGTAIQVRPNDAIYLNSNGIMTAINYQGQWQAWGNRTAAQGISNDVVKVYSIVQRELDWISNTLALTMRPWVDNPTNLRLIESITLTNQVWLSSLVSSGALMEGLIEFLQIDNPSNKLLAGIVTFHYLLTPPIPAEDIENNFEFDVNGLNNLFTTMAATGSSGVASGGGLTVQ